ncbi:MAG TPA: CbiX/SirB N-terminal domain-containing protein [Mycobacteriales bacterium]|jgi:sirohydrochlorin ferrochelatase|nr:CbiX/SirB N-terminal domain-containing protein [Mycobacteriales bacterium]
MSAPLIIASHGSREPAHAATVSAIAARVRELAPDLDVRIGYLGHSLPRLTAAARDGGVVVPLLLTRGYHVTTDIPRQAPGCVVTEPLGPDRRLAALLARRLRETAWAGGAVALAAAGSRHDDAIDDVRTVGGWLAEELDAPVQVGFVASGEPRLGPSETVASYLLADGHFAHAVRKHGRIVTAPLGADPALAEIVLDRYAAARATLAA